MSVPGAGDSQSNFQEQIGNYMKTQQDDSQMPPALPPSQLLPMNSPMVKQFAQWFANQGHPLSPEEAQQGASMLWKTLVQNLTNWMQGEIQKEQTLAQQQAQYITDPDAPPPGS